MALVGVLFAALGSALAAVPSAGARPLAGACADSAGVTVVVDFGDTGGGIRTRCAPAPVASGFEALAKAGFAITSVAGQPFLCRIDGEPADDPCTHTPSASRYWSYWHADRGASWTYSSSGASRKPPAGSVEGWSFGPGDPPGIAPPGPVVATTTTAPPPPTTRPTAVVSTTVAPGPVASAPDGPTAGGVPSPTTTPGGSDAGSAPSTVVTTAVDVRSDGEALAGPSVTPARSSSDAGGGSPSGALVGLAAVVAVGGLAAGTSARRRAHDGDGS